MKYLLIGVGRLEFFGTISSSMGSAGNISHIGHLGGIISGFIYILYKGNRPQIVKPSSSEGTIGRYLKKERLKKKQEEINKRIKAKNIIDKLLEKIAKEGMSALTPKEKKDLEWARRHYYPNEGDILH